MAEYIDKAVALSMHEPPKLNRHYQTDNLDDAYGQGWDDALCSIEHIPAADVVPVVHARWVPCKYTFSENEDCSNCGYSTYYGNGYNYCPNCGAKMTGGDNNAVD